MRVADAGGPMHYADFGGDGPPLVLVHGLGGMSINWLAVGPALARHHRVVAPDLVGFGATPPAGRRSTVPGNLLALRRFVELQGAPAVLVGNSMGGLLSAFLAAERPDLVDRLVLVDPACPNPRFLGVSAVVVAFVTAALAPATTTRLLRRRTARLGAERLVQSTLAVVCEEPGRLDPDLVAAHVELTRRRLEQMPWSEAALVEAARSLVRVLVRRERFHRTLARVKAPTLVIQGSRDRVVPTAAVEAMVRRRPDWDYAPLEGVGHVPMMEAPGRFLATLESWLGGRAASAGGPESAVAG